MTRREHGCWTNFETIPRPYVIHHVSSCFIMFHEYFMSISFHFPEIAACPAQVHLPVHPWQSQKASFVRQIEEPGAILQQETLHHARRITEELVPILSEKRILQMCNRLIGINEININWHDLISYILQKLLPPSHYKSIQKLSHKLRKRSGALGAGYRTQHTLKSKICLMSEEISGNRRKHNETYGEMQGYLNISQ